MGGVRAHYSTAIGGTGPLYYSPSGEMGDWFLENYQGIIDSGQFACFGMVTNLPHWPPYWAQVWGDVVMRVAPGQSGTAKVDLLLANSKFAEGDGSDETMGYRIVADTLVQSFDVSSNAWTTFSIPVHVRMLGNPIKESDFASDTWYYTDFNDLMDGYWWNPFVYWWYAHNYFPWLRVNSGPDIEVKILRLWDQPICSSFPGYRLNATGNVWSIPGNTSLPDVIVGAAGTWSDNNDATKVSFGWSDPDYTTAYALLEPYTGGTIQRMTLHFRASATADDPTYLFYGCFQPMTAHLVRLSGTGDIGTYGHTLLRFYGGSRKGAWAESWNVPINFIIPNDGIVREYTSIVDSAVMDGSGWEWSYFDDMIADLAAGNVAVLFDSDDFAGRSFGDPSAAGTISIHEAWLVIESPPPETS